ncbi:MAG: hypothetical protein A2516_10500 [Alphaproteobacteria bacterium RIFOXYD12_FULL_60_8]|nr:MAG: hypothetical protein A2516_10500 [Alphaproteobacteria bacterium RIFOXYD12_FULL_60_8]
MALLMNLAYEKWTLKTNQDAVLDAMREFVRAVEEHFSEEIHIIRQAGYEKWAEHSAIHGEFHAKLTALIERLEAGADMDVDTFTLLDRLLYEHEFLDDQDFWEVLKGEPNPMKNGEPLIAWSDDFCIGHPEIDRQHMALVKLINRLHLAIRDKSVMDKDEVFAEVGDILRHTLWHFGFEENLMREHDIRSFESHKILHDHLIGDLEGVLIDLKEGSYDRLEDLLENYLKYWLLDHIVHVDKGLGLALAKLEKQKD